MHPLRSRRAAPARTCAARGDLPALPAALPPDPDDHHGGGARRAAADGRHRRRLGAAPSARHLDRRRPAGEPGAHPVHHAGDLPVVRPAGAAVRRAGRRAEPRGRAALSLSTPFIRRPVATTLLTFGLAAAGAVAFFQLPVSPLPQVDYPTISVRAQLPGASPEVVATSVATPLERRLGQIADVTEMTSSSSLGGTRITLQFGLNRDINGAARDVQAAINGARADLPSSLRSNPTYRKVNPADAPILILALTSDTLSQGQLSRS